MYFSVSLVSYLLYPEETEEILAEKNEEILLCPDLRQLVQGKVIEKPLAAPL